MKKAFKSEWLLAVVNMRRKKLIKQGYLKMLRIYLLSIAKIGYPNDDEDRQLLKNLIDGYEVLLKEIDAEIIDKAKQYLHK